jgi:hypothetical protein
MWTPGHVALRVVKVTWVDFELEIVSGVDTLMPGGGGYTGIQRGDGIGLLHFVIILKAG